MIKIVDETKRIYFTDKLYVLDSFVKDVTTPTNELVVRRCKSGMYIQVRERVKAKRTRNTKQHPMQYTPSSHPDQ